MDLRNNILLNVSSLTDTRNKLLNRDRYKHASVKNMMPLSNLCSDLTLSKRRLDLTSRELKNQTIFHKTSHAPTAKLGYNSDQAIKEGKLKKLKASNKRVIKKKNAKYQSLCMEDMDVCDTFVVNDLNDRSECFWSEEYTLPTVGFTSGASVTNNATPFPGGSQVQHGFSFGAPVANNAFSFPGGGQAQFGSLSFGAAPAKYARAVPPPGASFAKASSLFGFGIEKLVLETDMPEYYFESIVPDSESSKNFLSLEEDMELIFSEKQLELKEQKTAFLNVVNTSLMCSPNFKLRDEPFRVCLINAAEKIVVIDPEFLLKVALYARQELNIRSTSNFLLAYAAYKKPCRIYLKKYFNAAINLPSDWLAVADYYVTFDEPSVKQGNLPSMLRKVMVKAFAKFDEYQLAKYNKKKKKIQKKTSNVTIAEVEISFTLKQLIRTLHITSPVSAVMCLLGKKYPGDPKSFRECGLDGIWESEKADKRMKLPIPETWETRISEEGNKAFVWESLIENSKLPYMATLRNLKNLIMAGISKHYHNKVMGKIANKEAVLKSRQFPLRFYSAYKILEEIEHMKKYGETNLKQDDKEPQWKKIKREGMLEKLENIEEVVLNGYKIALGKALEISALHNVDPIAGKSIIICDIVNPFKDETTQLLNAEKVCQNCILLGLLCFKACEDPEMKIIYKKDDIKNVTVDSQSVLNNMTRISSMWEFKGMATDAEDQLLLGLQDLLQSYLNPQDLLTKKINNIIFLHGSSDVDTARLKQPIDNFLHKYRNLANPDLLFVQVNLTSSQKNVNSSSDSGHVNDVYLHGFSDQILKFISEKGNGRQLSYVEAIDQKFQLCDVDVVSSTACSNFDIAISPYDLTIKWKTLRLFISSTFKDMHGERDLLMHYVIQELKKRAFGVCVHVVEIDLRWGVTEEYSTSENAAEICIREAQSCDIFLGILGERYGTTYDFDAPDDQHLSWVKDYQQHSSITELEIEAGAFRRAGSSKSSLFFIRDNDFIRQVPKEWISFFASENEEAAKRLLNLKNRIRNSDFHVVDGYHCQWGGVHKNKPFVAGLNEFGQRVLDDLWQLVLDFYKKEKHVDEISDEFFSQQSQMEVHSSFIVDESSPLQWTLNEIKDRAGVYVITGQHGYGKTAFMVKLIKEIGVNKVIPFFIGATSRSTDLKYMLSCIAFFISKIHQGTPLFNRIMQDIVSQFPEVLAEGARASGNKLVLVIDGLDCLNSDAQKLSWLPCILPQGVTIICSVSESSEAYKILFKRAQQGYPVQFAPLSPLNVSNRKKLVQKLLARHGKKFDESTFSNEMMQFITKTDCGLPSYIHSACDYFMIYATYDTLTSEIQNLPSSLPQLLEKIILQMEKHHKPVTIQRAFALLCATKEGLSEMEFHRLLSFAVHYSSSGGYDDINIMLNKFSDENLLPLIDFRSLLHIIHIFLLRQRRVDRMKLSSPVLTTVLRKIYCNFEEDLRFCHQLLAVWYKKTIHQKHFSLKSDGHGLSSTDVRSLSYHLYNGQCYHQLAETLCSLDFVEIMFHMHAADDILTYYLLMIQLSENRSRIVADTKEILDVESLHNYYEFVSQNFHVLNKFPQITRQQALNDTNLSGVDPSFISHCVKCLTNSASNSYRWLTLPVLKAATAVAIHDKKFIAASGNQDGYLKVFDHRTGKTITSLKVHSSAVSSLSFIGTDHMCIASADNDISIWNITDNILIAVVKGHTRYISSCIVDPTEKFIISSSWDCSIRLWSAYDGREISVLSKLGSPVNCITHHPQSQLLACGLWNSTIQIWNILSLKKEIVLEGHSHSIKAIAYSSDGLNILSSSCSSEVFMWSAVEGLKIGSIKGHILPVNSLHYAFKRNYFVSASEDGTLKVWSNNGDLPLHHFVESKQCLIHFMEFIRTNYIAVAFQNGAVWILDILDGVILNKFTDLLERVTCFSKCSVIGTGELVNETYSDVLAFCGTESGKILVLKSDSVKGDCIEHHNSQITYLLNTNHFIFSGTSNGDVGLLNLADNCKSRVVSGAHNGSVSAVGFSSSDNEAWCITASTDMTMKLWKVNSGEIILCKTFGSKHLDYITSCFFLPAVGQNIQFISGSADNTVAFWKDEESIILRGLHAAVTHVYATNNYIIGCSRDGGVAVWTKDGLLVSQVQNIPEQTTALAYDVYHDMIDMNEFNLFLAYVDKYGSIVVTRPFQRSLLCSLNGHSRAITSCSVDAKNTIISCSSDNTVNIWKVPESVSDNVYHHDGMITSVVFLNSNYLFVISGDANGNLVLWSIEEYSEKDLRSTGLKYCTHKKYIGGYINTMITLQENQFACAVTVTSEIGTEYFLSILQINNIPSGTKIFNMKETARHHVTNEILNINYVKQTGTIIGGLKSGNIILISEEKKNYIKMSKDWILKMLVLQNGPNLCIVNPNGQLKQYSLMKLTMNKNTQGCLEKEVFISESKENMRIWITAMCADHNNTIYLGDSKGWLRIVSDEVTFTKQIHEDAITNVHVDHNHLVTCSLDKLIKLWDTKTNTQIGQFHSDVPISCMDKAELPGNVKKSYLVIGSTVGKIDLLQWLE